MSTSLHAAALASPLFDPLRPLLEALPAGRLPSLAELNELHATLGHPARIGDRPLRFVPSGRLKLKARDYERAIFEQAQLVTRADNLHDLFNALCWMAFPHTKAALNRGHLAHFANDPPGGRCVARDVLTLFDEGGAIVACSTPELEMRVRQREWEQLAAAAQHGTLRQAMRVLLVGHAVYEKLLDPFEGIVARALFVPLDRAVVAHPLETAQSQLDQAAAALLDSCELLHGTEHIPPLPLAQFAKRRYPV